MIYAMLMYSVSMEAVRCLGTVIIYDLEIYRTTEARKLRYAAVRS